MAMQRTDMGQQNNQPQGERPGLADVLIEKGGRGQESAIDALSRFTQNPLEFWARTIINKRELARKRRIIGKWNIAHKGRADVLYLQLIDLAGRVSIGGKGREQIVQVATAERNLAQRTMDRVRNFGRGGEGGAQ